MRVDLESPDPDIVLEATRVIRGGGIVLYPSDTIYGLGCDPFHAGAVKKIYDLKGRDLSKGVLLLVPTLDWVNRLAGTVSPVAEYLMSRHWPGPLTLLFSPSSGVPSELVGSGKRIGVRYPESRFLQLWMNSLSGPIVSTSANLSGSSVPQDLRNLRRLFSSRVDLFLEAGEPEASLPSTVVDMVGIPRIVREGIFWEKIRKDLTQFAESSMSD